MLLLKLNHLRSNHACKIHSSNYERKRCPVPQISHAFSPSTFIKLPLRPCSLAARASNKHSSELDLTELGLKPEMMPKHVAIIIDGNRRWARNRMLPGSFGHVAGKDTLKQLAIHCSKLGIKVFTVYAFSTENRTRGRGEVGLLMNLFEGAFRKEIQELIMGYDFQVTMIGDRLGLARSLQSVISQAEDSSVGNKGMRLVIAANYSGMYDITEATKKIALKLKDGDLKVEDIDETLFRKHLQTSVLEYPSPDLLIRTSGEIRLSNFMMCQLAYTELVFVDKLFPDFKETNLVETLREFQRRMRRFGGK